MSEKNLKYHVLNSIKMNIRNTIKLLLNRPIPAKYMKVRRDDIFLVSFPKSGNTWLRFLIGNYLFDNVDFININGLMPDIHVSDNKQMKDIKRQRFIKSHFIFNSNYPRVIYIKRNIKDVLISYFYWFKKREPSKSPHFDSFFTSFINHGAGPYGTWENHINGWINKTKKGKLLVINYEDLKKNTYQEMLKVLMFCDLPLDREKLLLAIDKSNIKVMANLENKQSETEFFKNYKNNDVKFIRSKNEDRNQKLTPKQNQILIELTNRIL